MLRRSSDTRVAGFPLTLNLVTDTDWIDPEEVARRPPR